MHELKIANELVFIVKEEAEKAGLKEVSKVSIRMGRLVSIVKETFESAFSECARNSPAENATIEIEIVPVTLVCRNCGKVRVPEDFSFWCMECGSSEIDIVSGNELYVNSIEGE